MNNKLLVDGIKLLLAKSIQEAVDNIKENAAKEEEGHKKLEKAEDDSVHDPAAVDAAIQRYHSALKGCKATKPARSAAVNSIKANNPEKTGVRAIPKKIPSLKKPTLGKKEELDPGKDPDDQGDCLNKEEKRSKERQHGKDPAAVSLGRKGGLKGGPARMSHISHAQAEQIARKGADARWGGSSTNSPIKDQPINDSKNKDTKKGEMVDHNELEHPVDMNGTAINKPRDGAKLPPKRIPQIPNKGSGTGGELTAGKLNKGAIADAVNQAKAKARSQGISEERIKDAGFPRESQDAKEVASVEGIKKAGIPAAPTAPKPKMPSTNAASSTPPVSAPAKTPKAL